MEQVTPPPPLGKFIRAYWELTRSEHRQIAIASAIIVVMQGCAALEPLVISTIMKHAAQRGLAGWRQTMGECAGLFIALFLLGGLQIQKSLRVRHAVVRIHHGLQLDLMRKLLSLSGSYFEENNVTSIHGKISLGLTKLGDITFQFAHELIPLVVMCVATSLAVAWYSPIYTVIVIPTTVLYIVTTVWVRSSTSHLRRKRHHTDRVADGLFGTAIAYARTVWTNNQEARELAQMRAKQVISSRLLYIEYHLYDRLDFWRNVLISAARISCLLICIRQAGGDQQRLFVSGLGVLLLTERLFKVCYSIGGVYDRLTDAAEPANQMAEIRELQPTITDPAHPVVLKQIRGELSLTNVCYAYDSAPDILAVNNLTLAMHPGEMIGLIGVSGGGKSTLAKLLLRLLDPTSGSVQLDGTDLRALTRHHLRAAIAYVPQEIDLFPITIAENIAYGHPDATREEIITAARQAHAHDFIERCPQGYDTLIGENGTRLSGGQRQRLGIARALLRNAPIIIFDEATASVDVESDAIIHQAIGELVTAGRLVIVIAHRLATVQHAHRLVYLENGKIIETGSPAELLRRKGAYAHLFEIHARFDKALRLHRQPTN